MISSLTALILTYNEEENIERSLKALRWLEKVILVDTSSTDRTADIAGRFRNIQIYQREFDTHAKQWNAGLDLITTEWVLALDADYLVTPELAEEIRRLQPAADIIGYETEFRYLVFGRPLRGSIYPPRVALFRKTYARYIDEGHTQQLRIKTASQGLRPPEGLDGIGKLSGRIDHDDRKSLSRWIQSQDRYAILETKYLAGVESREEKVERSAYVGGAEISKLSLQDRLRKMIAIAPFVMPIYLLFARGLILDGWRGWYYVFQRTVAELLLSLRLLEEKLQK